MRKSSRIHWGKDSVFICFLRLDETALQQVETPQLAFRNQRRRVATLSYGGMQMKRLRIKWGLCAAFALAALIAPCTALAAAASGDVGPDIVVPAASMAMRAIAGEFRDPTTVNFDERDMRVAIVGRSVVVCGTLETNFRRGKLRWVELVDARAVPYRITDGVMEGVSAGFSRVWNGVCDSSVRTYQISYPAQ
jgi:hypothetical protein